MSGSQRATGPGEADHATPQGHGTPMPAQEAWDVIGLGAGHAILVLDTFHHILYASPNSRIILGHDASALVGRSLMDLTIAQDVERVADSHEGVMDGGIVMTRQRLRHGDGRAIWVETTNRLFEDDTGRCIVSTIRREPGEPETAAWSRVR